MNKFILIIGFLLMNKSSAEPALVLSSPSFDDNTQLAMKQVSNQGGCKGRNDSPALEWTDGPSGTNSYAVTVFDPDAPSGSGWWHWTLFNIPKNVTSLKEAMTVFPKGSIQGRNDSGTNSYSGACPPKGSKPHHYVFTVYALKAEHLPLTSEASGAMLGYYIHQNILAKDSVTATYSR